MRRGRSGSEEDRRTVAAVLPWLDDREDTRRRRILIAGLLSAVAVHVVLLGVPMFEKQRTALRRLELAPEPFRIARTPAPRPPEPVDPPEPAALEPPLPTLHVPVPDLPEPVPIVRPLAPELPPSLLPIATDPEIAIPEAPPEPDGIVDWDPGMERPLRLSGSDPLYTECARRIHLQGVVVLEAVIGRDGRASDVRILRDLPCGLGSSAATAVSQWTFQPATRNGEPLPVRYRLTARFNLR